MQLLSTVVVTRSTVPSTMDEVCSPMECAKLFMLSPRLMSKVLTRRLLPSAKPNQEVRDPYRIAKAESEVGWAYGEGPGEDQSRGCAMKMGRCQKKITKL